jgi:hypothetical protein
MTNKRVYEAPAVRSEPIKVGVFGKYGGSNHAPVPWRGRFFRRRHGKRW